MTLATEHVPPHTHTFLVATLFGRLARFVATHEGRA